MCTVQSSNVDALALRTWERFRARAHSIPIRDTAGLFHNALTCDVPPGFRRTFDRLAFDLLVLTGGDPSCVKFCPFAGQYLIRRELWIALTRDAADA